MNKKRSHYIFMILFLILANKSFSQDSSAIHLQLEAAKLKPYKMQVTYNKTSHLLFPSTIRYVDLGSDLLVANKAEPIGNVLRIKSAVRDFEEETNFSVITEDGKFYNFDVFYSPYPEALNYDLLKMQRAVERQYSPDVLFEDLKGSSSSLTELIMENLYEKRSRTIKRIVSRSFGIEFSVLALHVNDNKFYFTLQISNSSNVAFALDLVSFRIVDRKNLKRTVGQDKLIEPLRIYSPLWRADHHSKILSVFLLDQFTLLKDQVFEIEILEKNGVRHQKVQLKNADLLSAQLINSLRVKTKSDE